MPSLSAPPTNVDLSNHLEHVHLLLSLSEAPSAAKTEQSIDSIAQKTWAQPLQSTVNIDPRLFDSARATPTHDTPSRKLPTSPERSDSGVEVRASSALPDDELLRHLCELYFEHLNIWCPILHRQTIQNMLNDPSGRDEADNVLLHAIVAATLRFSNDIALSEARRKHMHQASKDLVLLYGMDNCSLRALQALTILTQDRIGSSHGTPTLNLLALITRSAMRLGLNKEGDVSFRAPHITDHIAGVTLAPPPKTWLEAESRRRLFWMVYLLDRHGATATGADFGIEDVSISLRLPCHEEYFQAGQVVETRRFVPADIGVHPQNPDNLGSFAFCVDMAVLTTQVQAHLKQTPQSAADLEAWQAKSAHLDALLVNWKASIPTDMAKLSRLLSSTGGRTVDPMWVGLTCTYHTYVLPFPRVFVFFERSPGP